MTSCVGEIGISHLAEMAESAIEALQLLGKRPQVLRIVVGIDDEMLGSRFMPRRTRLAGPDTRAGGDKPPND